MVGHTPTSQDGRLSKESQKWLTFALCLNRGSWSICQASDYPMKWKGYQGEASSPIELPCHFHPLISSWPLAQARPSREPRVHTAKQGWPVGLERGGMDTGVMNLWVDATSIDSWCQSPQHCLLRPCTQTLVAWRHEMCPSLGKSRETHQRKGSLCARPLLSRFCWWGSSRAIWGRFPSLLAGVWYRRCHWCSNVKADSGPSRLSFRYRKEAARLSPSVHLKDVDVLVGNGVYTYLSDSDVSAFAGWVLRQGKGLPMKIVVPGLQRCKFGLKSRESFLQQCWRSGFQGGSLSHATFSPLCMYGNNGR